MNKQDLEGSSTYSLNTFLWIAAAVGLILLIPAIAMHLTDAVNWEIGDFIVMGLLLFCTGSAAVFILEKNDVKYRVFSLVVLLLLFLYVWAELAVGIFTGLRT